VTENHTVTVTYTGYLVDGSTFETGTITRPLSALIAGWTLGVPGMKVGGKRRLVIGSNYGYGSNANGDIPPRSTLIFDVEVTAVQ
jgi:FKBP-type peptidyl-prolyl cis-trans isomerase FkpA